MHLLDMKGPWGPASSWLYDQMIGRAIGVLHARFVDEVVPLVEPGSVVIDVGCGGGGVARMIAERNPTARVVGIDLDPTSTRRASERHRHVANLRFETGSALDLPFGDGSADLVVSVASIKHWPDRRRGIAEIGRVLRRGATVCLAETDRECTGDQARQFVGYWRYLVPGSRPIAALYFRHVVAGQSLGLDELIALMSEGGFEHLDARRAGNLPFVVCRATKRDTP